MSKDSLLFERFIANAKKLELMHKVILEISPKSVADIFIQQPYARYLHRGYSQVVTANHYTELEQSLNVKFLDQKFTYGTSLTDFVKLQSLAHLQAYRNIYNNPNIAENEFVLIMENNQYLTADWSEKLSEIIEFLTNPNFDEKTNQILAGINFVGLNHSNIKNFNKLSHEQTQQSGLRVQTTVNLSNLNLSLEICNSVTTANFNAYLIRKRAITDIVNTLTEIHWPQYDLNQLFAFYIGSYAIANPIPAISMLDCANGESDHSGLDSEDLNNILHDHTVYNSQYDFLEHFKKYVFYENHNYQELAQFYHANPQAHDFEPYELVDVDRLSTADRLGLFDQYQADKTRTTAFPAATSLSQYEMLMSICRRTLLDTSIADHDWVIVASAKAELNDVWYDRLNYLIDYCNVHSHQTEVLILGQDSLSNLTTIPDKVLQKMGLVSPQHWQAELSYQIGENDFRNYYNQHSDRVPADANVSLTWSINYLNSFRTSNFSFFAIKKKALLAHATAILERKPSSVAPVGFNFAHLFQFYELNMAYVQPFFATIPANNYQAQAKHYLKQEFRRTSIKTNHNYDYDQELANLRALNILEYKGRTGFVEDLLFTDKENVNTYLAVDYANRYYREQYRQQQAQALGLDPAQIELVNTPAELDQIAATSTSAEVSANNLAHAQANPNASVTKVTTKKLSKAAKAKAKTKTNPRATPTNAETVSTKTKVLVPTIYERKADKLAINEIEQNLYDYELKMYVLLESGVAQTLEHSRQDGSQNLFKNQQLSYIDHQDPTIAQLDQSVLSTSAFAYSFAPKLTQPLFTPNLPASYLQAMLDLTKVPVSFVDLNREVNTVRDQVTDLDRYWLEPEQAKALVGINTICQNHHVHAATHNHSDCTTIANLATNLEQAQDPNYLDYLANTKKFLINLNSQTERYQHFYSQPNTAGFIHIPAVVGKDLTEADKLRHLNPDEFKEFNTRFPTPGEMGCTLSHRHLYQRIIADPTIDDNDLVLIAEDDIILNPDWYYHVNKLIHALKDQPNVEYLILSQIYIHDTNRRIENEFIGATYVHSAEDLYHEVGNFPNHVYKRLGDTNHQDLTPSQLGEVQAQFSGYTTLNYYRPSASSFYLVRKSALIANIEKMMKPAYWFADGYQHLPYGGWADTIGFSNPILAVQSKALDSIIEGERYIAEMNQKLENRTIDIIEPSFYYRDVHVYILQKTLTIEECQQRFPQATIIPRSNYESMSAAEKEQAFDKEGYREIYGHDLSDADIANTLTHYQALKEVYFSHKSSFACVLVLEDDVELAENWIYRINCLITYINTRLTLNTNVCLLANSLLSQPKDLTTLHSVEEINKTGIHISEADKLRINQDLNLYWCNEVSNRDNAAYFILKFAINGNLFNGKPCFNIADLSRMFRFGEEAVVYMDPCMAISPSNARS